MEPRGGATGGGGMMGAGRAPGAEGMAPSGLNDVLRAHQGAIKRWYDWTVPKLTGGTSTAYTLSYSVAPGAQRAHFTSPESGSRANSRRSSFIGCCNC